MGRLNKPAKPGYKYRSPNSTNANDLTPNLQEDAIASQDADIERIRKGLQQETRRGGEQGYRDRLRTQEAAGRALSRTLGRAGMAQAAFALGTKAGEEIDKRNPKIGKSIEDIIDKVAVSKDRVKLTDEAKQRIEDTEVEEDIKRAMKNYPAPDIEERFSRLDSKQSALRGYAKGGKVSSASKRADGAAQRGKTRGKYI